MAEELKLHLGCGGVIIPGYVNIDLNIRPGIDLLADLRRLPFAPGRVDFIYACAVIEHFERNEWRSVLAHWYAALKPGGTLRLSTSDFEACVAQYAAAGNITDVTGLIIGGQRDFYDWHGMIFDLDLLRGGLEEAGFGGVRRYDWRNTDIGRAGIDDYSQAYLPHMDKENGRLMALNVEADKPA
jgi:predicted SAM-dependent methyltransferase